MPRSLQVPLPK